MSLPLEHYRPQKVWRPEDARMDWGEEGWIIDGDGVQSGDLLLCPECPYDQVIYAFPINWWRKLGGGTGYGGQKASRIFRCTGFEEKAGITPHTVKITFWSYGG